jgi:MYXO-CTERM domain-containing protein
VADGGDCDDAEPAIHPGATELCNAIDDDCDEKLDAADGAADAEPVWEDWDADGYGACDDGSADCASFLVCPADRTDNFADNADDCDDANASVNPSQQEKSGNVIDENCDGIVAGDDSTGGPGDDPGCNCTTTPTPGAFGAVGLLLLLTARRRRT